MRTLVSILCSLSAAGIRAPPAASSYTEILEQHMGIPPWSWKGYLLDINKIDPQAVRETEKGFLSFAAGES